MKSRPPHRLLSRKNQQWLKIVKIQILANDLVRRLKNTSEELEKELKTAIVDGYTQKLLDKLEGLY